MNYMEQVANMLDIEFQTEQFEILEIPGLLFKLDSNGLKNQEGLEINAITIGLLKCELTIKKLPWIPKEGDTYYFVDYATHRGWNWFVYHGDKIDKAMFKRGVTLYKTEEEVKAAVKELGWEVE